MWDISHALAHDDSDLNLHSEAFPWCLLWISFPTRNISHALTHDTFFSRTPTTSGAPPVWPGIYVKPLLEPIVEITCGAPLWPGICAHCGDAGYHSLLTRWHRQQVAVHLHTGELLMDQKQQN